VRPQGKSKTKAEDRLVTQGTLEDIYRVIASGRHSCTLNLELEVGPRQIPVWKASVRKIINLNGSRFQRTRLNREGHPIFMLAPKSVAESHSPAASPNVTERDENSSALSSVCAPFKTTTPPPRLPSVMRLPSR